MKKILIITPFLIQGGVEHSLITALSGIDYNRYDVVLYLYREGEDLLQEVPKQVKVIKGYDTTHYYRKPYVLLLSFAGFVLKTLHLSKATQKVERTIQQYIHRKKVDYPRRKYFRRTKYDVAISYCLHIGTEMALHIKAVKRYLFIHNSHTDYHAEIFEPCAPLYDGIIAVSEGVRKVYAEQYPAVAEKIIVLENYVDAAEVREKAERYQVDYQKTADECILCSCGRFSPEKGFDLAVGAARILKTRGYRFVWFFVGDGKCRSEIEAMIQSNDVADRIVITGFQENPYPYIAYGDIYVQPSYEEAQPLTLLEARKLGRPIVSTRTVGGEGILKEGELGVLTDISAEGIADGIARLIEDPVLRLRFGGMYSMADDEAERNKYRRQWDELLSSAGQ